MTKERMEEFEQLANGASGEKDLEKEMMRAIGRAFSVWQERQRKYGKGNIAAFGAAGCVVRGQDKLARLRGFYFDGRRDAQPDETVEDSWLDLANYALMGLVCQRGKWPS